MSSSSNYNKRRRVRGGSQASLISRTDKQYSKDKASFEGDDEDLKNLEKISAVFDNSSYCDAEDIEINGSSDSYTILDNRNLIVIHVYDQLNAEFLLPELQPSCVIMYEPNPSFIRNLEIYRSSNPQLQVKVYFMYYGYSVEEQKYLGSVRREKESFTKLIREKSKLPAVITNDVETHNFDERFRHMAALANKTTRIAGGQLPQNINPVVIVDFREFRSSLPFCLHTNNIGIVPVMLIVGDYVLSPRICVERKSIPDLISSFRDGRIFTQCESMFRFYDKPILLIEFDESKSFSLEPFGETPGLNGSGKFTNISSDAIKVIQEKIQGKLMLLLLQFPRLRIIWSMSPRHTAEIFYDLKLMDSEQPDPLVAGSCGIDSRMLISKSDQKYNRPAIDILKTIPGINPHNFRAIIDHVKSLQELCSLSKDELTKLIGKENMQKVQNFLNKDLLK